MQPRINPQQKKIIKDWLGTGSINLFGPPYAGKDTQGELLVTLFEAAPLLGGGDILRASIIPEHVRKIMDRGELIPTKDYIEIVLPYLGRPDFDGKPLILSAVGRWHGEEEGVLKATSESNHPLKVVIHLTLPEEIIWQRWQSLKDPRNGGIRQDEARDALAIRLQELRAKTLPVIDFYRDRGIVVEVDGSQPPESVFQDIIAKLSQFAQT